MARSKMGLIRFAPFVLSIAFIIISFVLSSKLGLSLSSEAKSDISTFQVILFFGVLVFFFFRRNILRQYLDKTIFEEAVTIDQLLHKRLKELQLKKSQFYTRILVIIVCILVLLLIFTGAKIFGIL